LWQTHEFGNGWGRVKKAYSLRDGEPTPEFGTKGHPGTVLWEVVFVTGVTVVKITGRYNVILSKRPKEA